jgi:hypothetical protein
MHLLVEWFVFFGWWFGYSEIGSQDLPNASNVAFKSLDFVFVFTSIVCGPRTPVFYFLTPKKPNISWCLQATKQFQTKICLPTVGKGGNSGTEYWEKQFYEWVWCQKAFGVIYFKKHQAATILTISSHGQKSDTLIASPGRTCRFYR